MDDIVRPIREASWRDECGEMASGACLGKR